MTASFDAQKDESYEIVKEGPLDVKYPYQRRLWKVWSRLWVVASITEKRKDVGNIVTLQLYSISSQQQQPVLHTVELKDTVTLFRCDSRSHPGRTFGIMIHGNSRTSKAKVLLYLAGEDERNSENWLAAIRNALLPPSPLVQLEGVWQKRHDVSLIDTMYSFQHGLLGTYGYLLVSGDELVIVHPHTSQPVAQWAVSSLQESKLLRVDYENAPSGAFAIVLLVKKKAGSASRQIFAFYSLTARQAVEDLNATLEQKSKLETKKSITRISSYERYLADLVQLHDTKGGYYCAVTPNYESSILRTSVTSLPSFPDEYYGSSPTMKCELDKYSQEYHGVVTGVDRRSDNETNATASCTCHVDLLTCDCDKACENISSQTTVVGNLYNNCMPEAPSFLHNSQPICSDIPHASAVNVMPSSGCMSNGASRSGSSSSSSSSGAYGDSSLWSALWGNFLSKQEERLANLNVNSLEQAATSNENLPLGIESQNDLNCDLTSLEEGLCGYNTFPAKSVDTVDFVKDRGIESYYSSAKRDSTVSILSQDSHVYADISLIVSDDRRRSSLGGQTLYEEVEEDSEEPSVVKASLPPQLPPRPEARRPSTLKLKELSANIENVLSSIEKSSSTPGTPERSRKQSPTTWLNPIKGVKKILRKDKKKSDENSNKGQNTYSSNPPTPNSPRQRKAARQTKVKRVSSQPIFYCDRRRPRNGGDNESSSSSSDGEFPSPLSPIQMPSRDRNSSLCNSGDPVLESSSPDSIQFTYNPRQICLNHLLESVRKGEKTDACDCSSNQRSRSRSSARLPDWQHFQRRQSKSLSIDIERHLELLNTLSTQFRQQQSSTEGSRPLHRGYSRQESSDYYPMTPPETRRSRNNTSTSGDAHTDDRTVPDGDVNSEDYVYMKRLSR